MLRVTDQIVNPRQPPQPSTYGFGKQSLPRVDNLIYDPQNKA